MPAQVLLFPSSNDQPQNDNKQTLADVDQLIRRTLAMMNHDETLINHVAGRMKDYVEKYASITFNCKFDMLVPLHTSQEDKDKMKGCLDKGIQALASQVQDMVNKIIMERILLEIKIYEDQKTPEKAVKLVPALKK